MWISSGGIGIKIKSLRRTTCLFCLILAAVTLAACTKLNAKLDRSYLPQGYQVGSIRPEDIVKPSSGVYFIELTNQVNLTSTVGTLWRRGAFHDAFHDIQPLSVIYQEDISNLLAFIDRLYTIYLVAIESNTPVTSTQLRVIANDRLNCSPLSNIEIRFQMNTSLSVPFSKKPLTMLLISTHEMALRKGAKPIYPHVLSPHLRKRYQLPPLKALEDANLFATKNGNRVYSTTTNGFVVCKRRSDNIQINSKGR